MKRYPVYKDSGIEWLGEIPQHWELIRLKYIFQEVNLRSEMGNEILLSMTQNHGLIPQSEMTEKPPSASTLVGYKLCNVGEIVMNKMQAWNGMFSIVKIPGIVSPDYTVFKPCKSLDIEYYIRLFKTPRMIDIFHCSSKGLGTGFFRLYTPDFGDIFTVYPPLEEEKAIAHFIDRKLEQIERFIRNKKRLIELINEQKTAIINRAVTKGINHNVPMKHSGIEWLGEIPSHWDVIKLGRLCKVTKLTGFEYTKLWKTDPQGAIIALRGLNIKNNRLMIDDVERISAELSNQLNRSKLFAGDIVFPCTGTLGHGALIEENDKFHINQNIAKITPTDSLNSEFLLYVLCCSSMQYQINRLNSSGLQPVLLIGTIRNLIIQIPPKVEQEQIVQWIKRTIAKIDLAIAQIEKEIELIQEYRTTLVSEAVTGKIDVRPNSLIETTLTA
jgi:type I restriction enzyme S subunit